MNFVLCMLRRSKMWMFFKLIIFLKFNIYLIFIYLIQYSNILDLDKCWKIVILSFYKRVVRMYCFTCENNRFVVLNNTSKFYFLLICFAQLPLKSRIMYECIYKKNLRAFCDASSPISIRGSKLFECLYKHM